MSYEQTDLDLYRKVLSFSGTMSDKSQFADGAYATLYDRDGNIVSERAVDIVRGGEEHYRFDVTMRLCALLPDGEGMLVITEEKPTPADDGPYVAMLVNRDIFGSG